MFQPQKVYVDSTNNFCLTFDTFSDLQPITLTEAVAQNPQTTAMDKTSLNNEAEAMTRATTGGITFDVDSFFKKNYHETKTQNKARSVLNFLTLTVDDSLLRFTQAGGIVYQRNLVPGADLTTVLKSLVSKKSKMLVNGEFFLLCNLKTAPPSILAMINPSKLKLCNIQQTYKDQGPQPPPPAAKKRPMLETLVKTQTANPQLSNPNFRTTTTTASSVSQKPKMLPQKNPVHLTKLQKRFNSNPAPAWYKIL